VTTVDIVDEPTLRPNTASGFDANADDDDDESSAAEAVEDVASLRSTLEVSEERRLKRRRISQKTAATPIFIRLDSEDFGEVL